MNFSLLKEKAFQEGINEIEIYTVIQNQTTISTFNQEVDSSVIAKTMGMAIRGVYNNQGAMVFVENDNEMIIDDIIKTIKENASLVTKEEPYFIFEGSKIYPTLEKLPNDFNEFTLKDKTDICLKLDQVAKRHSDFVTNTQCSFSQSYVEVQIENSNGLSIKKQEEYLSIYFSVVCNNKGDIKTVYDFEFIRNIKDFNPEEFAIQVTNKVLKTFGATSLESKNYPVVIDAYAFGNIMSGFVSIFSAEAVIKKLSLLQDKVDTKVFGENITLIDDPLDLRAVSQSSFDDEGVATFQKTIVENGVLKTYFHNLKTAKMLNTTTTANASKAQIASSVGVNPSNFYIKHNDISFDDMIKDIKEGVFIIQVQGLHAGINAISGQFSLQSSGFYIKDGKLDKPVTLIILSGNITDMLNNVVNISNDFTFKGGFGTGSVHVKELSISGE